MNTEGTLVIARQATGSDWGGYVDQTVNGVTFLGNVNSTNGVAFTIGGQAGYHPTTFISTKRFTGPDAVAYGNMLAGAWHGGTAPVTCGVSGLTAGHKYLVQLWVADFREYPNARFTSVTTAGSTDINLPTLQHLTGDGTNPGSGTGRFVIGRFAATGPCVSFSLTGNESSQLNAFQLRDITPVTPTYLAWSISGTNLMLSWPSNHLGWPLLTQTNKLDQGVSANTNDWAVVPGSTTTNQAMIPIDPSKSAGFYRMAHRRSIYDQEISQLPFAHPGTSAPRSGHNRTGIRAVLAPSLP